MTTLLSQFQVGLNPRFKNIDVKILTLVSRPVSSIFMIPNSVFYLSVISIRSTIDKSDVVKFLMIRWATPSQCALYFPPSTLSLSVSLPMCVLNQLNSRYRSVFLSFSLSTNLIPQNCFANKCVSSLTGEAE